MSLKDTRCIFLYIRFLLLLFVRIKYNTVYTVAPNEETLCEPLFRHRYTTVIASSRAARDCRSRFRKSDTEQTIGVWFLYHYHYHGRDSVVPCTYHSLAYVR